MIQINDKIELIINSDEIILSPQEYLALVDKMTNPKVLEMVKAMIKNRENDNA